jgi:light-regulated signal transduction histidine kinase (bacteriophytochrome)
VDAGHLPVVSADRTSMVQLLQNLVGNALKFQKPGTTPRVRISAVEDGARWTVSVADNGIGIAPEHFERIFVIFQRLHAREAYAGTGIGLSICKKIVECHGGRIGAHSQPDVGTTFWFTLPKDASRPSAEPT